MHDGQNDFQGKKQAEESQFHRGLFRPGLPLVYVNAFSPVTSSPTTSV